MKESDENISNIADNYAITNELVDKKVLNKEINDSVVAKRDKIKDLINNKIAALGSNVSMIELAIGDYISLFNLKKSLNDKTIREFDNNLENKNSYLTNSINESFYAYRGKNGSINDLATGLNELGLYESKLKEGGVNNFNEAISVVYKDMVSSFAQIALDRTKKLQMEYSESGNKYDRYIGEIKSIVDIGKKFNIDNIVNNSERTLSDIYSDKNQFEKNSKLKVRNIMKKNLIDNTTVINAKKELDDVKKEIDSTESIFVNLKNDVIIAEDYIKLNTNLIRIKENEKKNSKKKVSYLAISGSLLGVSFASTVAGIGLFGARGYYGNATRENYNYYINATNQTDMDMYYKKVEEYSSYTDGTLISGIITLALGGASLVPGIVMMVLTPRTNFKEIKNLENQIKKLNVSYNIEKSRIMFSYGVEF